MLTQYLKYIRLNTQYQAWDHDMENVIKMINNKPINLIELMRLFYSDYASSKGKLSWGDKTPSYFRFVKELYQMYPKAKFIHVVRDGRDTYLSMKKRGFGRNNVAVGGLEWKYKIQTIIESFNKLEQSQIFEIKYEDIIQDPINNIMSLCNFLGVKYENNMLEYYKSSKNYIREEHSQLIFHPISTNSLDRYKTEMSNSDNLIFQLNSSKYLNIYSYETVDVKNISYHIKIKNYLTLMIGLPKRISQFIFTFVVIQISSLLGIKTTMTMGKVNDK